MSSARLRSVKVISCIIPVRNGADTLAAQLDAFLDADPPHAAFEILVADNGSTDGTAEIAGSYADCLPVRVVDVGDVMGPGAVRNLGVRAAAGDWLVFCDADDEVDRRWLVEMERAFEDGHEVIGGPISYQRLNSLVVRQWRGASGSSFGPALGFMPFAHSSNLGVTRAVFEQAGGFDAEMRPAAEDVDFSWRVQLLGYAVHEASAAIVHYRLRGTIRELARQSVNYGRSEVLLYRKYREHGLRRPPPSAFVHELWWLASRLPFSVPLGRRGAWVRKASQQWGRLLGSIQLRTLWW